MTPPDDGPGGAGGLHAVDSLWRAANFVAAAQLYLTDNPLLRRPLAAEDLKRRILGHWGTVPGLTLVYAHLCRIIRHSGRETLFIAGPGHGGPALLALAFLEGTLGERDAAYPRDEQGLRRLVRAFSTPGGLPSHAGPPVPGSIHEGGELGYSLSHATGAVLDAPGSLAVCVIGDGEAETGPLAASWHGTSFLDPVQDGAVLPVLHLNGYKIAGPTVLARMPREDLSSLLRGYGYDPVHVTGDEPAEVHRSLADALAHCVDRIDAIQAAARGGGGGAQEPGRPRWPMIVLRTPKGWTGPDSVDGTPVEGTFRAHQVPLDVSRDAPQRLGRLESWLRSYRPEELFDADGRPTDQVLAAVPEGTLRMSANPRTAGGTAASLVLPDTRPLAAPTTSPGTGSPTEALGALLREVIRTNPTSFRLFSPDETDSNRLSAVFEITDRVWQSGTAQDSACSAGPDADLGPRGRVTEVLSEHLCEGWLEGYVLTGRHGMLASYEAFAHIAGSMVGQFAKWLEGSTQVPWRHEPPSLNLLLTSHAWRQDHNGFSHQDPGFIDLVLNKRADLVRVLLPPDANTMLAVAAEALSSSGRINVVVAGKHPSPVYFDHDGAVEHCTAGAGVLEWAGTERPGERTGVSGPDVVLACAGEAPTREVVAAAALLASHVPELVTRVVNVVDLLRLAHPQDDPRGLPDEHFDALFTADSPVVFAFHGYPGAIHRLTHRRACHGGLHVHGYRERGATTTPFDMLMLNDMDRFTLAIDALSRVACVRDQPRVHAAAREFERMRAAARRHTREYGVDDPELTADPRPPGPAA